MQLKNIPNKFIKIHQWGSWKRIKLGHWKNSSKSWVLKTIHGPENNLKNEKKNFFKQSTNEDREINFKSTNEDIEKNILKFFYDATKKCLLTKFIKIDQWGYSEKVKIQVIEQFL